MESKRFLSWLIWSCFEYSPTSPISDRRISKSNKNLNASGIFQIQQHDVTCLIQSGCIFSLVERSLPKKITTHKTNLRHQQMVWYSRCLLSLQAKFQKEKNVWSLSKRSRCGVYINGTSSRGSSGQNYIFNKETQLTWDQKNTMSTLWSSIDPFLFFWGPIISRQVEKCVFAGSFWCFGDLLRRSDYHPQWQQTGCCGCAAKHLGENLNAFSNFHANPYGNPSPKTLKKSTEWTWKTKLHKICWVRSFLFEATNISKKDGVQNCSPEKNQTYRGLFRTPKKQTYWAPSKNGRSSSCLSSGRHPNPNMGKTATCRYFLLLQDWGVTFGGFLE